jgi:hypothetical protein
MGLLDLVITYLTMLCSSMSIHGLRYCTHIWLVNLENTTEKKSVRQRVSRLKSQSGTLNLMYDCCQLDLTAALTKLRIWVVQVTKLPYHKLIPNIFFCYKRMW